MPLVLAILLSQLLAVGVPGQEAKPLYVAIIWHYHQPWYYDVNGTAFLLPWVRMHTAGNYYKMAYILSKYPSVKVTFTFSGSLIRQILDYNRGLKDYRQVISEKIAGGQPLTVEEKFSMLVMPGGFFDVNWGRVVNVVPRFRELRDRAQSALTKYRYLPEQEYKARVAGEFSDQDYLDLAVLFNLFWIDPEILREQYPQAYQLRQQALAGGGGFTRQQLQDVLSIHRDLLSNVLGIYASLAGKGQAELIPVPYSHPLAPILADLGLQDDVKLHVSLSTSLFQSIFNYKPKGVWPAEQAVNDYVLSAFAGEGYMWTVTDETLLVKSGFNPADPSAGLRAWYATYDGRRLYVFFRNRELSDLVGFQYGKQDPRQAAQDFVGRLLNLAKKSDGASIVVVALDGENPWEYYQEFGDTFLEALYSTLTEYQSKGALITTTPAEYLSKFSQTARELPVKTYRYLDLAGRDISNTPLSYAEDAYTSLPRRDVAARIPEGSWSGGELATWIGQRQENAAWMMLVKTRSDVLRKLCAQTLQEAMSINPRAVEDILRAEASDWTFWYGGEMGLGFPANPLYKGYLRKAYLDAGMQPPDYLLTQFNPDATPVGVLNAEVPKPPAKEPTLDGTVTASEWACALNMSMGDRIARSILLLPSSTGLYVAVIPVNKAALSNPSIAVAIYTTAASRSVSPMHPGFNSFPRRAKLDLGVGLFFEVLIFPANSTLVVSAADGRGGWTPLFYGSVSSKDAVEAFVPWGSIMLSQGEQFYVAAVAYDSSGAVEYSSRVGSVYQLLVPRAAMIAGAQVVFEATDPEGDDDGAGGYKYPKADVFTPGVFDLTRFRVLDAGSTLIFEVYVRSLGGNPWSGPNGFCLQYPHIYIHTALRVPGRTDTFGLNVNLTEDSAWHVALLLAPGWGSDPVPSGERAAIYFADGSVLVQGGKDFKVYADPARNAIVAEVVKSVLPDTENVDKWVYTVAVTSYDGYGSMRIRPFGVDPDVWVVGAGAKHAKAVLFNVIPRVIDLLAPTAQDQYAQLNSYIAEKNGTFARVRGVSKAAAQLPSQQEVARLREQLASVAQERDSLRVQVTDLQSQVSTLQEQVSRLQGELQAYRASYQEVYRSLAVGLVAGLLIGAGVCMLLRPRKRE
jgi:alpha-amylase/alpha-mannosidase (GH57 family)/FtsZ-binding cell division protein ZapB